MSDYVELHLEVRSLVPAVLEHLKPLLDIGLRSISLDQVIQTNLFSTLLQQISLVLFNLCYIRIVYEIFHYSPLLYTWNFFFSLQNFHTMYRVARVARPTIGSVSFSRSISYKLPTILALDSVKSKNQDFQGLFSAEAIDQLWYQRGAGLIDGLNQLLAKTSSEDGSDSTAVAAGNLQGLIAQTIRKPELYGVYAYSAQLYNLQFFFEGLKESSETPRQSLPNDLLRSPKTTFSNEPHDDVLREWIIESLGSIAEFRTLLLNSAKGIKGDGTAWLVAESKEGQWAASEKHTLEFTNLAVVNTYNTGVVDDSLRSGQLSRLQQQKQAKEAQLKEQGSSEVTEELKEIESEIERLALGTVEEAEFSKLYHGKKLLPVLAIDASMRNYLFDYGVYGKQQYLENVWECIDWDVVARRLPKKTVMPMPAMI